jgi:bacteriocin-like protein
MKDELTLRELNEKELEQVCGGAGQVLLASRK